MEPNYNFLNEGQPQGLRKGEIYIVMGSGRGNSFGGKTMPLINERLVCNNGGNFNESWFTRVKRSISLRWMELKYFVKHGKRIND
jgi:hypothetical protein